MTENEPSAKEILDGVYQLVETRHGQMSDRLKNLTLVLYIVNGGAVGGILAGFQFENTPLMVASATLFIFSTASLYFWGGK
jgi:uncharacterized membrane protein YoaK (UPF0700 family)